MIGMVEMGFCLFMCEIFSHPCQPLNVFYLKGLKFASNLISPDFLTHLIHIHLVRTLFCHNWGSSRSKWATIVREGLPEACLLEPGRLYWLTDRWTLVQNGFIDWWIWNLTKSDNIGPTWSWPWLSPIWYHSELPTKVSPFKKQLRDSSSE